MEKNSDPVRRPWWVAALLVASLGAGLTCCRKEQAAGPEEVVKKDERPKREAREQKPVALASMTDLRSSLNELGESNRDEKVLKLILDQLSAGGEGEQKRLMALVMEELKDPFKAAALLEALTPQNRLELVMQIVTKAGGERVEESKDFLKTLKEPGLRDMGCAVLLGFLKFDQSGAMRALVEEVLPDGEDRANTGRVLGRRFVSEVLPADRAAKGAELVQWLTGDGRNEVAIAAAGLSVPGKEPQEVVALANEWGVRPDLFVMRSATEIAKGIQSPADIGKWLGAVPADDVSVSFYGSAVVQAAAGKFDQAQLLSLIGQVPEKYRQLMADNAGVILSQRISADELRALANEVPEDCRERFLGVLGPKE